MKLHRYRTLLFAACCFALALVAAAPVRDAGAAITISSIEDLQKIGNDAAFPLDEDYLLGADIDASDTAAWNSGDGFNPIGDSGTPFTGTFDGKGYTIRELKINRETEGYVGLFGYAEGAVFKDINFDNATVNGDDEVGILVGYSQYSAISGCNVTGRVSSDDDSDSGYVGGVVGNIYFGSITACTSAARVTGGYYYTGGIAGYDEYAPITGCSATGSIGSYEEYTGGIVGYIGYANIADCFATCPVSSYYYYTGGIAGYSEYNTIENCYATGPVAADDDYVGGLVGEAYTTDISNCYATGAVSGMSYVGGLVGYHEYGTITNCSATGLVSGDDYVGGLVGEASDTNAITGCSATGAVNGGDYVGGLTGYSSYISMTDCSATGAVNGYEYVGGLSGYNEYGSTIKNCSATGAVTAYYYVGGLVGYNYESNISTSSATGPVSGSEDYVGGLVGYHDYGAISNSSATGLVLGYGYVGGLVGYHEYGPISDSSATGTVSGSDSDVGGLVGYLYEASIARSYAAGAVSVGQDYVGGLVGQTSSGYISNCYALGAVTGGYEYTGGLVGYHDGYINNSYSAGTVTGYEYVGGLVGYTSSGGVTASFWDADASGFAESDGGEGKTTAEMKTKATFTDAGWDFAAVWDIRPGLTYPMFTLEDLPLEAEPDNYTTPKNTQLTVGAAQGVLANDTNPNGDNMTAVLVEEPARGSLTLNPDGSFDYIPDRRFQGIDTFSYKAVSGALESAPVTVTITVGKKRQCPVLKLYGERTEQVKLLRKYRDRVMKKTTAGRAAVSLYYRLAPAAEAMLETSPWLGRQARAAIDMLLPVVQQSVKR